MQDAYFNVIICTNFYKGNHGNNHKLIMICINLISYPAS